MALQVLWIPVFFIVGCHSIGERQNLQYPKRVESVTMETVRVTARESEEGRLFMEVYDARDLLRNGNAALAEARYDSAIEHYEKLVEEFPASSLISAAYYNWALSLERLENFERAAQKYLLLVEVAPRSPDVEDSLFQAARCYERLNQWNKVIEVLARLLEIDGLSPDEHLEALARIGTAHIEAGELQLGENVLRRAIFFYRRTGEDRIRTDYYLGQAQHFLGEGPRREIAEIPLTNVESQFRVALERRCELLLEAQTQYVQAIRVGNAHWGAASAYRIGEMYSSLYDDVMNVSLPEIEVPPDLTTPEEIEAFRDEYPRHYRRLLRQYLEPLLHNAIRWWESNLMMIERTGVHGEWVERTRDNLERIKVLLDEIGEHNDVDDDEERDSSLDTSKYYQGNGLPINGLYGRISA